MQLMLILLQAYLLATPAQLKAAVRSTRWAKRSCLGCGEPGRTEKLAKAILYGSILLQVQHSTLA